ncbi:hypothetical protein Goari_024061 [Gossypium aridum]|uniref:Uncharacterized protein n=1 Tax=Gossypium aridum TaxID=34290 RepID=A0A7J8X5U6_GOSAI|nr:hypothetical protein [Gossypium aridum]
MSKFIKAFRELASYKELLRSQVEHVLIDQLMHFMNVDLQDAKANISKIDVMSWDTINSDVGAWVVGVLVLRAKFPPSPICLTALILCILQESRRRFDKAISTYDQAREKFVSLKKNTPGDIVAELEEVLFFLKLMTSHIFLRRLREDVLILHFVFH